MCALQTLSLEPKEYAVNRYDFEAERLLSDIDTHLADKTYMLGDTYTIVDMAVWGWARMVPFILGEDAWQKLPNLKTHLDTINARPAASRAEVQILRQHNQTVRQGITGK